MTMDQLEKRLGFKVSIVGNSPSTTGGQSCDNGERVVTDGRNNTPHDGALGRWKDKQFGKNG